MVSNNFERSGWVALSGAWCSRDGSTWASGLGAVALGNDGSAWEQRP
jgi:hypothetical protein